MAKEKLAELFVELTADPTKWKSGLKTAETDLTSFGTRVSKLMGGLAIGGVGAALLRSAEQLQQATFIMARATGATGSNLEALNKSFTAVYKTTSQSSEAVATAIAKVSIETKLAGTALEELSGYYIKFAKVTRSDVTQAVDSSIDVFKQWGITGREQIGAMDSLLRVMQTANMSLVTLTAGLASAGPALRLFGFSFEEAALLVANFADKGVEAGALVQALNTGFTKLAATGRNPREALIDLTARMKDAGTAADATNQATMIFGTRGVAVMTDAVKRGAFSVNELTEAYRKNTSTVGKLATETTSFSDSLTKVWHTVETKASIWADLTLMIGGLSFAIKPVGAALMWFSSAALVPLISRILPALGAGLTMSAAGFAVFGAGIVTSMAAAAYAIYRFGNALRELWKTEAELDDINKNIDRNLLKLSASLMQQGIDTRVIENQYRIGARSAEDFSKELRRLAENLETVRATVSKPLPEIRLSDALAGLKLTSTEDLKRQYEQTRAWVAKVTAEGSKQSFGVQLKAIQELDSLAAQIWGTGFIKRQESYVDAWVATQKHIEDVYNDYVELLGKWKSADEGLFSQRLATIRDFNAALASMRATAVEQVPIFSRMPRGEEEKLPEFTQPDVAMNWASMMYEQSKLLSARMEKDIKEVTRVLNEYRITSSQQFGIAADNAIRNLNTIGEKLKGGAADVNDYLRVWLAAMDAHIAAGREIGPEIEAAMADVKQALETPDTAGFAARFRAMGITTVDELGRLANRAASQLEQMDAPLEAGKIAPDDYLRAWLAMVNAHIAAGRTIGPETELAMTRVRDALLLPDTAGFVARFNAMGIQTVSQLREFANKARAELERVSVMPGVSEADIKRANARTLEAHIELAENVRVGQTGEARKATDSYIRELEKQLRATDKAMRGVTGYHSRTSSQVIGFWKSVGNQVSTILTDLSRTMVDLLFPKTTASTKDVAAITKLGLAAGITGSQLTSLVATLEGLALATGESFSTLAEGAAEVFRTFGLSVTDQIPTLQTLFAVSRTTGIGIQELMQSLARNAATFKAMGLSTAEAALLLGNMSREAINSTTVMSSLEAALKKITEQGFADPAKALQEIIARIRDAGTISEATALSIQYFGNAGAEMARLIRDGKLAASQLATQMDLTGDSIEEAAKKTKDLSHEQSKFAAIITEVGKSIVRAFVEQGIASLIDFMKKSQVLKGLWEDIKGLFRSIAEAIGLVGRASRTVASELPGGILREGMPDIGGPGIPTTRPPATVPSGGGAGGAAAGGTGTLGIVNAVTGAITAGASVVSAVWDIRMEGTLNAIEWNTRKSSLHLQHLLEKANEYWPGTNALHDRLAEANRLLAQIREACLNFVGIRVNLTPGEEQTAELTRALIERVQYFDTSASDILASISSGISGLTRAMLNSMKIVTDAISQAGRMIYDELRSQRASTLERVMGSIGGFGGVGGILGGVGGVIGSVASLPGALFGGLIGGIGSLFSSQGKDIGEQGRTLIKIETIVRDTLIRANEFWPKLADIHGYFYNVQHNTLRDILYQVELIADRLAAGMLPAPVTFAVAGAPSYTPIGSSASGDTFNITIDDRTAATGDAEALALFREGARILRARGVRGLPGTR